MTLILIMAQTRREGPGNGGLSQRVPLDQGRSGGEECVPYVILRHRLHRRSQGVHREEEVPDVQGKT